MVHKTTISKIKSLLVQYKFDFLVEKSHIYKFSDSKFKLYHALQKAINNDRVMAQNDTLSHQKGTVMALMAQRGNCNGKNKCVSKRVIFWRETHKSATSLMGIGPTMAHPGQTILIKRYQTLSNLHLV